MARKKHKENIKPASKKVEETKDVSPFASIVLKEKKEEPKKAPQKSMPKTSGKKPHEIVQGYNPNASFADILFAFEHTGNPYSMPDSKKKKIAEKKTDFGAILDQWEGKSSPKKKAKSSEPEKKSEYKPTKSFADILSQFEGGSDNLGSKMCKPKDEFEKPVEKSFFRDEDEDHKRDPNSSWSILGNNESYVRPAKKEAPKKDQKAKSEDKKEYKRTSSPYKATKDFADILSSFEGEKKKEEEKLPPVKEVKKNPPKAEDVKVLSENNLFKKEDEDNKRAKNASWSVLGGNDSFVRPEPKKEAPPVEKEKPKAEPKRVSEPYKATKDFGSILSSYESKKDVALEPIVPAATEVVFDEPVSANNLFKKEDEDNKRAENASWSILGGNDSFVRPQVKAEEPKEEKAPVVERVSESYVPTKDFSEVLKDYENKQREERRPAWSFNGNNIEYDKNRVIEKRAPVEVEPVKTFEEILQEKGDNKKAKPQYSISELRRMLPQATLDLHGETIAESEAQIKAFLEDCSAAGLRKISIITGKGLHSEGGVGVLRDLAERVLEESGMVGEKNNAPLRAGGSGALWIILKP